MIEDRGCSSMYDPPQAIVKAMRRIDLNSFVHVWFPPTILTKIVIFPHGSNNPTRFSKITVRRPGRHAVGHSDIVLVIITFWK